MRRAAFLFLLTVSVSVWGAEAPFKRGVNLTSWFQVSSMGQFQFTRYAKEDFNNIKTLGCDVIRLPIDMHALNSGPPDYTIDPLLFYFLDQVVDWAEELEIHLILDNHSFDPATDTTPTIIHILTPVWTQMAEHYKDRSMFIYYEVLNEPHGISDLAWNTIQRNIISVIRRVDTKHTIVVGPAGWNSYHNLEFMPEYTDNNLIYTFHFYDPFVFTHQGASWSEPSMVPLSGVPFPYDPLRMPVCPPELESTWISAGLYDYQNEGTVEHLEDLLNMAADFQASRQVVLYCGELGVYIPNSENEDRVRWYRAVRTLLDEKGIVWTIWDYPGGFGLFEAGTNELFRYDLNLPLLDALGFAIPEQEEFVLLPDTAGFDLYQDYIGPHLDRSGWTNGAVDFYSDEDPARGKYCIFWSGGDQYGQIGFRFRPVRDLTLLVQNGYAVDLWIRGDTPGTALDIRFIDTKTADPDDHPWRMRMTLDEKWVRWDGTWNHLQIPLKRFTEHGSWDNGWFNPAGDFEWGAVDRFEIVAEHHSMDGIQIGLDHIVLVDPAVVNVQNSALLPEEFTLFQNYPNPFNASTTLRYDLPRGSDVHIRIFDTAGRRVRTLFSGFQPPGEISLLWDGRNDHDQQVPSGIYTCQIETDFITVSKKIVVLK